MKKGQPCNNERKQALSLAAKRYWANLPKDSKHRQNLISAAKVRIGQTRTPEQCRRISKAIKAFHARRRQHKEKE